MGDTRIMSDEKPDTSTLRPFNTEVEYSRLTDEELRGIEEAVLRWQTEEDQRTSLCSCCDKPLNRIVLVPTECPECSGMES